MLKVGITGQSGFIGTHIFNTLGLYPDNFLRIPFEDRYFRSKVDLNGFVSSCDVIIHLAAMNRHNDQEELYLTNISLVKQIIESCEVSEATPHIIFSSSIQEEKDNLYGRSKKEGRELFEMWAKKNGGRFSGLIIPNVFGPFGHPYYNSVVATFCHQLTHNELPEIKVDGELNLIYVADLVQIILERITYFTENIDGIIFQNYFVPSTATIKVSDLLQKLSIFKNNYFENGMIPDLNNVFDRNLFNTLLTYIDHNSFFPFLLKLNTDERGSFVETMKLNSGGQVSFSTTKTGITRGNHFHTRKAERFAVIKGKAKIEFRRIGTTEKFVFYLDGDKPSFVDMPVWFTHNITNIGTEDVYTFFWISEHFNESDSDTYFEIV